jgi:hypothetical protein
MILGEMTRQGSGGYTNGQGSHRPAPKSFIED